MNNSIINNDFVIRKADTVALYDGLRDLWHRVFGDDPEYIDSFYRNFGADICDNAAGCASGDTFDNAAGFASDDICGYVVAASGDDSKVVSALTCYRCGTLRIPDEEMQEMCGKPVYVSYAICTDPEYRGLGLAGMLTEHVRDIVIESGGLSLVSPAEPSLQDFYSEHGYRPYFFANEVKVLAGEMAAWNDELSMWDGDEMWGGDEDDNFWADDLTELSDADNVIEWPDGDPDPVTPSIDVKPLDPASYNRYREAFLLEDPHVELSKEMLDLISAESLDGKGLLEINHGDAVCALQEVTSAGSGENDGIEGGGGITKLIIMELLVNPMLLEISSEIDTEIASLLADHYGAASVFYRTPGMMSCQSMLAGSIAPDANENIALDGSEKKMSVGAAEVTSDEVEKIVSDEAGMPQGAYFGFPIE